jgi:ketosteroid isomerase-like protein
VGLASADTPWVATSNAANLRRFLKDEFTDIPTYLEALKRGTADVSLFSPDVEYEDSNLPDHVGEHYRGVAGLIRAGDRWLEGADWITVELEQVIGDGERVVSIHRLRHKATHLDRAFEQPLAYIWTFRDEKIVHFTSIRDPDEALELAGLRKSST